MIISILTILLVITLHLFPRRIREKVIFRIIFIQLLDLCAVRAAFHYVYLCHNYIALCVFNSFLILAYALFILYNTFSLIRLGNRCSAITRRMVSMLIIIKHESF